MKSCLLSLTPGACPPPPPRPPPGTLVLAHLPSSPLRLKMTTLCTLCLNTHWHRHLLRAVTRQFLLHLPMSCLPWPHPLLEVPLHPPVLGQRQVIATPLLLYLPLTPLILLTVILSQATLRHLGLALTLLYHPNWTMFSLPASLSLRLLSL